MTKCGESSKFNDFRVVSHPFASCVVPHHVSGLLHDNEVAAWFAVGTIRALDDEETGIILGLLWFNDKKPIDRQKRR